MSLAYPPENLVGISTGSFNPSDFDAVSEEFLRYFREWCGLKPFHSVLDVGCGVGRMARALTGYLDDRGSYRGFDVNREQIEWCSEVITPVFPNFEFAHVDVANSTYNEKGAVGGSEFRFPYADESFDLVFMTSIVTHMLPATVERYLAETTRVLKGGGRALITWFLLNVEQRYYMQTFGKHGFTFQGAGEEGVYAVQNPERPEDVVAYEDVWVKQAYLDAGLVMKEPIRFGSWSGRPRPVSYQDIVVSRKEV